MQEEAFPITVIADGSFSNTLRPLLNKLEMWINFQALKYDWYGNEDIVLIFNYTLVRTFEKKELATDDWVVEKGFAYHYQSDNKTTNALIEIADLVENKIDIEQSIKNRITQVANAIAVKHNLVPLV